MRRLILPLGLLLGVISSWSLLQPETRAAVRPASAEPRLDRAASLDSLGLSPVGASSSWTKETERKIRESEYEITWQVRTRIPGLSAAWHAPNRAHNFRSYFTEDGLRLIPRVDPGGGESTGVSRLMASRLDEARRLMPGGFPVPDGGSGSEPEGPPAWELGLSFEAYGRGGVIARVEDPVIAAYDNRIDYDRGLVREWFENSPGGLEHGFVLAAPPAPGSGNGSGEPIHLLLELRGDLSPQFSTDGQAVDFLTAGGSGGVRYERLAVTDATGRALPARMKGVAAGGLRGIGIVIDDEDAVYPVTVDPFMISLSWTEESDQALATFGNYVVTAGDVNADGYSDVVVGAKSFDNGEVNEGRAFLYLGSASGLAHTPAWTAEGDQAGASFGFARPAGDVNGDGYADVIVGAPFYDNGEVDEGRVFLYLGSATGLDPAPAWTTESNQAGAIGGFGSTAGDVNGDGYSDLFVGIPFYSNEDTEEGRSYVFYGSPSGPGSTPDWTAEGDQASAHFGFGGTAGDVDGDGYSDLVVAALTYSNGEVGEGAAFVYLGSSSGLSSTPDWTAETNQTGARVNFVSTAGDVNGDGYSDLLVSSPLYSNPEVSEGAVWIYHGSAAGLSGSPNAGPGDSDWSAESNQANAGLTGGWTAGDVNGDGYADVVVSARGYDDGEVDEGAAFLFLGSADGLSGGPIATPASADWTGEGNQAGANYGINAGTAGDVNGDGFSDLIVGSELYDNGEMDEGRAFLYMGGPGLISGGPNAGLLDADATTFSFGFDPNDLVGNSVAPAGDVNGDGFADVIIGVPAKGAGMAFVSHGRALGNALLADWSVQESSVGGVAAFGHSVGTAGDVNGDGYSDVIVGAPQKNASTGKANVYLGSSAGLAAFPAWTMTGTQSFDAFGVSVGSAGDVNGDGYSDVIVGAYGYSGAEASQGAVYVFLGSMFGLQSSPAWSKTGSHAGSHLGFSVATAGDVNGDGYSDVVVGEPDYSNGESFEGAAYVYLGSASGLSASPNFSVESDFAFARLGWSVGTAGDVNGDGYSDVLIASPDFDGTSFEGRVWLYMGSPSGISAGSPTIRVGGQVGSRFGQSVGTAGDVNGDGFSDVIIYAPTYDNDQMDEGRAFVYLGSASGLGFSPAWTGESDQTLTTLKGSVATAGDYNGDGFADILVGLPEYDAGTEVDEGRALLYLGNGGGLSFKAAQIRAENGVPIDLVTAGYGAAVRLAMRGRTPFGRARVKLEWELKPLGTPLDGTGTERSADWVDSGTAGAALDELIIELALHTSYHWRVRTLYDPVKVPFAPASRWYSPPRNGWEETDFRPVVTTCFDLDGDDWGGPGDVTCPNGFRSDCADTFPDIYPGAPQICDGFNNDCNDPFWPLVRNTTETDDDGDGWSECAGDCDDANPYTYAGAVEVNDGRDNQCPGEPGYGLVDEISGTLMPDPSDPDGVCWTAQRIAREYEVARSTTPDFSTACATFTTSATCYSDSTSPPPGQMYFYRVRALMPHTGSWGVDSMGNEVIAPCSAWVACQATSNQQTFTNGMYGCSGTVDWPSRETLCNPGFSACPARAWVDNRAGIAPRFNYWSDDDLLRAGWASGNCYASPTEGWACDPDSPMRVCSAFIDGLGNRCDWIDCGFEMTSPSEFFGGCLGNPTAGALCCQDSREQVCGDGLDEDGDGLTDCADPDCTGVGGC